VGLGRCVPGAQRETGRPNRCSNGLEFSRIGNNQPTNEYESVESFAEMLGQDRRLESGIAEQQAVEM